MARLTCTKCGRSGQYRKTMLFEKYNADIPLPDLRRFVADDCRRLMLRGNDPRGVQYVGLQ